MARNREPTTDEKIADALRAAPPFISSTATVVDRDMRHVLRQGTSDWTCVPSAPGVPWPNSICADRTTMQWFMDITHGRTPTIDRIGISYMLLGETGADFEHPELQQPPPGKTWYRVGPHVMFVFPQSAGDLMKGIGNDTSSGLPYARPFKGAQPLLVVPIGLPNETLEIKAGPPTMPATGAPTTDEKIADALRAAPAYISRTATVVDRDMHTVLRPGISAWTCMPSAPGVPLPNSMCGDPTMMRWFMEVSSGRTPTIDRIGISYMLVGETGADFDHPEINTPPPGKTWYRVGPHVMFVFPQSAGDLMKGIGHDTSSGLPYARPFNGAQPLLVVPIALPDETLEIKRAAA